MTVMPPQKPGRSKQDYGTPRDFLDAVERRFGFLDVDLAARDDNKKAPIYIGPELDSLKTPWVGAHVTKSSILWLNPPFGKIGPWARKCAEESKKLTTGRILFLIPASIGSNWYWDYVHGHALTLVLSPRLCFDGIDPNPKTGLPDPYPKDLMLGVYGDVNVNFIDRWIWKEKRLK